MTVHSDDEVVFTDLFEQHRDPVYAFLLGRTSDPQAASDLLQEAFLRLWRRLDEVAGLEPGRQRAWLFTVARNLVIDRYRSEATRTATDEAVARNTAKPDPFAPGTAEHAVARDELGRLHDAIGALPEDERVVLTMTVVAGMTSQDIAASLDVPAGTVRSRLHQARRRLAAKLETEDAT